MSLYQSLDLERREIRLLTIHEACQEGEETDRIKCALTTWSLDDLTLHFDALSYAWAGLPGHVGILVDEVPMSVTANLYAALRMFRDSGILRGRQIWIDAICINQQDMFERSRQVALMKDLYVKADIVRVWLGPGVAAADNLTAMASVKAIYEGTPPQEVLDQGANAGEAFRALIASPYWSRLWVIQEAALAREPVAYLGDAHLPFWELAEAFGKATLAERDGQLSPTGLDPLLVLRMKTAKAVQSLKMHEPGPLSVLHVCSLLHTTAATQTIVDHDRVFGLLGLLPDDTGPAPDYSLDVVDVYHWTVSRLMEKLGSLHLLVYAGIYPGRRAGLPSWSLDFGEMKDLGLYGKWTFRADAAITVESGIISNRRVRKHLGVRARALDTVIWLDLPCPTLGFPEDLAASSERSKEAQKILLRWRLELERRTQGEDDHQRTVCTSFWRTVTNDTIYVEHDGGQTTRQWTADDYVVAHNYDRWLMSEAEILIPRTRWLALCLNISNAVMFFTSGGGIGMTSAVHDLHTSTGGDTDRVQQDHRIAAHPSGANDPLIVAIVAGLCCPALLRPFPTEFSDTYQFIGAAYVDDVMYGEAIRRAIDAREDQTGAPSDVFEQISLV